jgi:Na+-translocating ferredoxin:NAD+ oxidoreductase RnfA subunit
MDKEGNTPTLFRPTTSRLVVLSVFLLLPAAACIAFAIHLLFSDKAGHLIASLAAAVGGLSAMGYALLVMSARVELKPGVVEVEGRRLHLTTVPAPYSRDPWKTAVARVVWEKAE